MTFMACSSMSLRAVSEARRAAEASSSTSMEATDSDDRFSRAVARRDLGSTHSAHAAGFRDGSVTCIVNDVLLVCAQQ